MSKKSLIDESILYRLTWEILTNAIVYFSLFITYIVLLQKQLNLNFSSIIYFFSLGIIINIFLSIKKIKYFQIIGNMLPFLFLLGGMLIFIKDKEILKSLKDFFIIIFGYSIINAISQEILETIDSVYKSIIYFLIKINRILWVFITYFSIANSIDIIIPLNISFLNTNHELTASGFFVLCNLISLIIESFSALLLLFTRNIKLVSISQKLKQISSWSIDDKIIENEIMQNKNILKMRTRIIMFGDIRGFTAFSEKNDVKMVVFILKNLYEIAENKVKKYKGYKPEFIADEFITFFSKAHNAVQCGYELNIEINNFLKKFGLSLGIGINKGQVFEGLIGGINSKKYTILGKAVNTAARLQANAKGGQILVSKDILEDVPNLISEKVYGLILKGVDSNFEIYEMKGFKRVAYVPPVKKGFWKKLFRK